MRYFILRNYLVILILFLFHRRTRKIIKMRNIYAFFTVILFATNSTGNQEVEGWTQSCNKCTCMWMNGRKAANCSNLHLHEIPSNLSTEIEEIDLSGNSFHDLGIISFLRNGYINIKVLRCQNCRLAEIDDIALEGLFVLKKLDLSKNNIQRIPRYTFDLTLSLVSLNFSFNKIHSLEITTFSGLRYLEEILLNDNKISFVDGVIFEKLPSLQHINLANNELKQVVADFMENSPKLNRLDLQGNPWICDCRYEGVQKRFLRKKLFTVTPICAEPSSLKGKSWSEVDSYPCDPSISKPPTITSIEIASMNLTLTCKATGIPPPEVYWITDGKTIGRDFENRAPKYITSEATKGNYTWNNLTIINVDDGDQREYKCIAQNSGQSNEHNVTLIVTKKLQL
ncbi:hypothetical protein HHI36_022193 [Cryptolaemus montrouzieri]|uniref:Ig-like domain-containing protein n=1 Tax=Cryptolaemus montrouzieri TaxID=559131 RepID=A0ABD2MZX7_9CUCU